MSSSLVITWASNNVDVIPIAGQRTISTLWRALGEELGLFWIPQMYNGIPINSENLDAILNEVEIFRDNAFKKGRNWAAVAESANRLAGALHSLKGKTEW